MKLLVTEKSENLPPSTIPSHTEMNVIPDMPAPVEVVEKLNELEITEEPLPQVAVKEDESDSHLPASKQSVMSLVSEPEIREDSEVTAPTVKPSLETQHTDGSLVYEIHEENKVKEMPIPPKTRAEKARLLMAGFPILTDEEGKQLELTSQFQYDSLVNSSEVNWNIVSKESTGTSEVTICLMGMTLSKSIDALLGG
jgi:hypothetical protein